MPNYNSLLSHQNALGLPIYEEDWIDADISACIPLRRKATGVGANAHWGAHPMRKFALAIPTCWYLKTRKFALPPTRNIKLALPPTQNPNVSQWNISCVGSPTENFRVGHVHFFFVSISFTLGPVFQLNMGFRVILHTSEDCPKGCISLNYSNLFSIHMNVLQLGQESSRTLFFIA